MSERDKRIKSDTYSDYIYHILKKSPDSIATRTQDLGHGRSGVRLAANTKYILRGCTLCNDTIIRFPYNFIIGYDLPLCPMCVENFEIPVYQAYVTYMKTVTVYVGFYDHHSKINHWYCVVDKVEKDYGYINETVNLLCHMCFEQGGRLLYYMRMYGEEPLYGLCVEDLGSGNPLLDAPAGKTKKLLSRQEYQLPSWLHAALVIESETLRISGMKMPEV